MGLWRFYTLAFRFYIAGSDTPGLNAVAKNLVGFARANLTYDSVVQRAP